MVVPTDGEELAVALDALCSTGEDTPVIGRAREEEAVPARSKVAELLCEKLAKGA